MSWSFPIGVVRGTVVRVHFTFVLFLIWIAASYYTQGGAAAAAWGVLFIVLIFLCVLLHEFGHVLMARHFGVRTPDITLLPIGGVARLERIPEQPTQELLIALAGPAVNVVIAIVLFFGFGVTISEQNALVQDSSASLVAHLAIVNAFLVIFNLIPAFPMDGGRVLRAVLAYRLGFSRATQIAATVGQGFAFVLGAIGLVSNPLLLFIAVFVWLGAAGEAHAAQLRQVSQGMIVADAMITHFERLSPGSRIEDAVECLIRTTQHEFPVVDGAGRLRGVLTRDAMVRALREHGPDFPALEAMQHDIPTVSARQNLDDALRQLQQRRLPALGVVDADARLIGLLTPENIGEMMLVQSARPQRFRQNPWDVMRS